MATRKPKLAQSMPIDPKKHKDAQKQQKLYNKGKGTDNPYEKDMFLKRSGPQLPLAKKATKGKSKGKLA
jgi:hypothetical protein